MRAWMLIVVVMVAAGCGSGGSIPPAAVVASPSASPMRSATPVLVTPVPSPTRTPEPSPTVSPTPAVELLPGQGVDVTTTSLRVRSHPSTGAWTTVRSPRLNPGDRAYVIAGPAFADGYTWYQVRAVLQGTFAGPLGWIAVADKDGDPWVRATNRHSCPDLTGSGEPLDSIAPELLTACADSDTIEFRIRGHFYCEPGNAVTPTMFGDACGIEQLPGHEPTDALLITLPTTRMGGGGPGTWRLIGHMADPAADLCALNGYPSDTIDEVGVVHYCRSIMVLDTIPSRDESEP